MDVTGLWFARIYAYGTYQDTLWHRIRGEVGGMAATRCGRQMKIGINAKGGEKLTFMKNAPDVIMAQKICRPCRENND